MLTDERCWQAVVERDRSFDGRFFFGVTSTGIFCRPSCPARRPRRENVRFFSSPEAAEAAGLRSCRRCRPNEAAGEAVTARMAALCEHLRRESASGEPLSLTSLAHREGMSPRQLRSAFQQNVGMTPRQFVEACRLEELRGQLRGGGSVTDAIYEAGYGSSSQVYGRLDERLGMTPGQYQAGGRGLEVSYQVLSTDLGLLMLGATDRGLCFVQFGDSEAELLAALREELPAAELRPSGGAGSPQLTAWAAALAEHLAGERPHLSLPGEVRASAFRHRVWSYLQSIPYGEVRSYSEVAAAIGEPKAVRAVASACAGNPLALLVPCHRVIRASGDLGGYRWGLERKRQLLERERRHAVVAHA